MASAAAALRLALPSSASELWSEVGLIRTLHNERVAAQSMPSVQLLESGRADACRAARVEGERREQEGLHLKY